MIQDKIFFDEKDPTGVSYNTPFTVYGSYQGRLWSKTPTGSIKYYTQNSDLSVYATTGSNQFSGSQTVTGSLTVTGGITGSVTTASYVEYTGVANKPTLVSGSAQVTYSGLTGIPAGIVSSSAQVTYSGLSGIPSEIVSSSTQITGYSVFATTGSNQFNGSQAITGSLTVTGQVVAQTLNVQQVTSSIVFSSGSNIFGNTLGNTQQFTGSVSVTGSLTSNGVLSGTSAAFTSGATFGSTVRPITNFAADLGTSSFRWADIFGYALNLSGGTTVSTRLTIARGSDDSSQNLLLGWNSLTVQRTSVPLSSAQTDFSIIQQGSDSSRTPFYISSGGNVGIGTNSPSSILNIVDTSANDTTLTIGVVGEVPVIKAGGVNTDLQIEAVGSGGYLNFVTNGNPRMRILGGGDVGIGTTSPNARLESQVGSPTLTAGLFYNYVGDQTATTLILRSARPDVMYQMQIFNNTSTECFRIEANGNVKNTNSSYGSLSDIKIKENIIDATPKLNDLLKVRIRNYNIIGQEVKQIGVIAQELEEIFPSMVDENQDRDNDGNLLETTTKGVKYSVFVPILIKSIQEQQTQIESLKSENDNLKSILQRNNIS
jgi:hypothetical protein